jgi:hypothetical protein
MRTVNCKSCGGMVIDGKQKYHHLKRCVGYTQEGIDHLVCKECGYKSPVLSKHIVIHGMNEKSYLEKYPGSSLVLRSIVQQQSKSKKSKGGYKPVSKKRGAVRCPICQDWYQPETSIKHRDKCVASHSDKYVEGKDYVKCPECGSACVRLGKHLRIIHGWDKDRIALEVGRGLKLSADSVVDKWRTGQDFKESQKKREKTHFERHGFTNPFSNPVVQEKITETSQRRYGVNHPMKDEEILIRQRESAQMGPSSLEVFFMDKITVPNVIYSGYGGRFIRTKIGVRKYGRVIKDLNPDFMVLPDNVLVSAKSAVVEGRPLDRQKHRTRWVIELLGDWFHSERMIGVKPEEHEREVVASYKSAGIECLTLWEKDVMERWDMIGPMVEAWIERAVRDMNENPIYSRSIKTKTIHM